MEPSGRTNPTSAYIRLPSRMKVVVPEEEGACARLRTHAKRRLTSGLRIRGFSAYRADPSLVPLLEHLGLGEARGQEEVTVLAHAQVGRSKEKHRGPIDPVETPALVGFRDDRQPAPGLEHAPDLLHILRRVRPVVMRLDRGDEIERAIGEGQAGHGPLLDLDTALLDPSAVGAARDVDTRGGVVDAG